MNISKVADIIHKIADGFEENGMKCLSSQSNEVIDLIQEQLYSGIDGKGDYLSPNYDDDPYFEEEGYWYHRNAAYKAWKKDISPPISSPRLCLSPRPIEVPNLYIDGTFFGQINSYVSGDALVISPGNGNGPAIREKYGDKIFMLGTDAVEWFNLEFMLPSIVKFFKDCGYQ